MMALWRPQTFSTASEISPRDARARAASTASSSRFPSPVSVALVMASRQTRTFSGSRMARSFSSRAIWA